MARKIASLAGLFTMIFLFFIDRNYRVLPKALHGYLPKHHNGLVITDVRIARCSSYNLFSSCSLDPNVWQRIDKDLYLGKSMSHAYVHIQRKRQEELLPTDKIVVDIAVGRLDPATTAAKDEKPATPNAYERLKMKMIKVRRSIGAAPAAAAPVSTPEDTWEARDFGLWLKRRPASRHASGDAKRAVTEVDVLFGDDAVEARDGWSIRGTPLLFGGATAAHVSVHVGKARDEAAKPQLRIGDNGKFKILQLADLHLSTGVGHCREAVPDSYKGGKCEADPRTLDFVARILEEERPDLVVLSGDQVNGETAPDAQSAIFKYASLLIKHKIPYVSIFGNHDDEGSLSRSSQMALIETLPYSLSKAGPENVDGVGNYVIEVLARSGSAHSALSIYLLDTHAYSPDERKYKGYDWLKPSQIDWFHHTAQSLKKSHAEYTHVHMDVAFIHIPLPEYRNPELYFKGPWKEAPTAPVFNSGFRDALIEEGISMVSCGHDHVNEYCAMSTNDENQPKLWMCYGGGAGFGGYGGYGDFLRKVRLFDFDINEGRITTWKRVEYGDDVDKKLDFQTIVDAGHPIPPPEE